MSDFFRHRRRWLMVGLLFLVAVVNNLDRQSLSILAPTLQQGLGFGPREYSYIVSAFLAAYALGYLFSGRLLDRLGVKLGLAVALAFWSGASLLHAAAWSWIALAGFRFLLGLGESFNSPAAVKAVAEWIPRRERALCMSITSNGNIIGAVIAPPLVAALALTLGWRWAFAGTAAAGLAVLALWWRQYESPERDARVTPEERAVLASDGPQPAAGPVPSLWALLGQPVGLGFFFCRFLTDPLTYFLAFWLPEYLHHDRGFSLVKIGLVGWIPVVAAVVGGPGGGALSDWLIRQGWPAPRARAALMLLAAGLMPLAIVAARTESVWLALALIGLMYAAQSCWMGNQLTLIAESAPPGSVATLLALSALGGSLGGIAANLFTGRTVQSLGYGPVFTAFGLAPLLAFAVVIFTLRRLAR